MCSSIYSPCAEGYLFMNPALKEVSLEKLAVKICIRSKHHEPLGKLDIDWPCRPRMNTVAK